MRKYIDIETIPTSDSFIVAHIAATLKPPGSMKKEETIQKWLDDPDNLQAAVSKTGLQGKFGQIACIGIADDQGDPEILYGEEQDILAAFMDRITLERGDGGRNYFTLVGHNSDDFDLPFISQRMMVNGMGPLFPFNRKPYDRLTEDTEVMFLGNQRDYLSLVDLCVALDVDKPLDEIDGSQVAGAWADGRKDLIYDHCRSDVIATRGCHHKMIGADFEQDEIPF